MFFALKGDHFDGNAYAADALDAGAIAAVIDDESYAREDGRTLVVENSLESLQALARFYREQISIPVIGLTGSNGKTTTKELLRDVLSQLYRTHATPGNYNNHIGLPLTLLKMKEEVEIAIIEMGANHQGEIDMLCRMADPTHGLITNIGKAHLEGFGGLEGVKKGKSELYRHLERRGGTAFVNRDEPFLTGLSEGIEERIFYGTVETLRADPDSYSVRLLSDQPFLKLSFLDEEGREIKVASRLSGLYNLPNMATAIAVGKYFRVPATSIKTALESFRPAENRSQVIESGTNTYLLDAYNANPTSMEQALRHFARMPAASRVAVLGDMLELGRSTEAEHRSIVDLAISLGLDEIVLVGENFAPLAREKNIRHFEEVKQAKRWLSKQNFQNTHLLIKGSRGMQLEKLIAE